MTTESTDHAHQVMDNSPTRVFLYRLVSFSTCDSIVIVDVGYDTGLSLSSALVHDDLNPALSEQPNAKKVSPYVDADDRLIFDKHLFDCF